MSKFRDIIAHLAPTLIFILVIGVFACDRDLMGTSSFITTTPEGILNAPSQLTISGRKYELESYLWRDFQPISPPDGKPLIALVRLVEIDSLDIPGNVTIDFLWVINGEETWLTPFSKEERPPQPEYRLEEIARDGPKWGPGITVDVVVRVRAGSNDAYRILATEQMIKRTD